MKNEKLRAEVLAYIRSGRGLPSKIALRAALLAILLAGAALGLWALLKDL